MAGLVSPTASPFLAVGGTAIDRTPPQLKDFAVRTFGTYDKTVLLLGMAVVIGAVEMVAGLVGWVIACGSPTAVLADRAGRPC